MPKRGRSSGENLRPAAPTLSPQLENAIALVSQQIGLLPDNSLAQLLKSISAEQGQRNPKRRKKTPHHDYVVSKLDTVCESDFNAQLFLQPCLPSSQKGPPLNSNPNTPDTSAVSLEVGSLEAVQQVTHQALVFQLPNTTSRGPPLHTTSISAIYRTLNGSEKTANTVQFFYSVVLYRIESLVTQAYRFKKPFPELTDYFVDVIAAGRIESESEKARKVIRKGFKRYVRLGAKVDSILAHGGEGWLFGLSTAYTASNLEHDIRLDYIQSEEMGVRLAHADTRDQKTKVEQNIYARKWLTSITARCISELKGDLPTIQRVRLEGPGRVALQAILEEQARLGNTFTADVVEILCSLDKPGKAPSSGYSVPQERSRNGVAFGLTVQLPHPKTQVSTRRHSDHQAISSTSSNTSTVNQVNNDLHSNQREPSPYQDTTFSTQYPGLNRGAVGAPDNLSTYNRYISSPNVSAQPHYPGDPHPSECLLYNSHNVTNTSEQPELTPAYDRGLGPPPSDSLNTPNVLELAPAYESGFGAPPSDYGYFVPFFDAGFGPPPSDYDYAPFFDAGLGPPPSDLFDTANVSMQPEFT